MIRFPILALLLATCVSGFDITRPVSNAPDLASFLRGPRTCFTPCGMRATEGDCESLQRYEGRVIKRLAAAVPGWSERRICSNLAGYSLLIRRHDAVLDKDCSSEGWKLPAPDGRCVRGYTVPNDQTITVATTEWDRSSLAHEIVHAGTRDSTHCAWTPWLKLALYELSHRVDPSAPEVTCSR